MPAVRRWAPLLLAWLAVSLLVSTAKRPPILDLAHQLDQSHLLDAVYGGERPDLRLNWFGPNKIGLLLVVAVEHLTRASWAPRAVMIAIVALWFLSMLVIGVSRKLDPWAVALASLFILGSSFYAGFINFLSGVAALAFWSWELQRDPSRRSFGSLAAASLVGALFLYFSHALWFAMGAVIVSSFVLLLRFSWREVVARALGSGLIGIGALVWRESLSTTGWQSTLKMVVSPIKRLTSFDFFSNLVLGGLRGPWENLFVGFVLLWLLFSLAEWIRTRGAGFDRFLLLTASFLLLMAAFAPDKVDRTLLFAWRWGPLGAACAVLAFPPPFQRPLWRGLLVTTAALFLLVPTANAWRTFETEEMAGFEEVLAAIPEKSTIAGLDFVRKSPRFPVDPYFQMFAYASVERRARINFSFCELASSLVVAKDITDPVPWSRGIEWNPHKLIPSDLQYFDYLLVHAPVARTRALIDRLGVVRFVAGSHQWALLGVDRERAKELLEALRRNATSSAAPSSSKPIL